MWGFSISHLLILLLVVLLFGARRLPELGSSLGKGLRAFKKGLEGVIDEDQSPRPKEVEGPNENTKQA